MSILQQSRDAREAFGSSGNGFKRSALILVSGTCWRLVQSRLGSAIQYIIADIMNMEMRPVQDQHMHLRIQYDPVPASNPA
jgi:hypothetical protein